MIVANTSVEIIAKAPAAYLKTKSEGDQKPEINFLGQKSNHSSLSIEISHNLSLQIDLVKWIGKVLP